MRKTTLQIIISILGISFASAMEFKTYTAYISKQDLVNSSGKKINTAGGILQQDRANFHKFNKKDEGDSNDGGFFASAANRAKLAKHADGLTGITPEISKAILKGNVLIRIDALVEEGEDYMLYEIVR
jgi:hypothetical protein